MADGRGRSVSPDEFYPHMRQSHLRRQQGRPLSRPDHGGQHLQRHSSAGLRRLPSRTLCRQAAAPLCRPACATTLSRQAALPLRRVAPNQPLFVHVTPVVKPKEEPKPKALTDTYPLGVKIVRDPPVVPALPPPVADVPKPPEPPPPSPYFQVDPATHGCSERMDEEGSYMWILKSNRDEDRQERYLIAEHTREAVEKGGYQIGEKVVELKKVSAMVENTKIISPTCPVGYDLVKWPKRTSHFVSVLKPATKVQYVKSTVLDVALQQKSEGKRVAALNAASAYHAGGGFTTGGRHALEEAMCVQSTLYRSIHFVDDIVQEFDLKGPPKSVYTPDLRYKLHIPEDGVILSPFIEIFRGSSFEGYPFMSDAVEIEGIISVAMPNRNPNVRDSPVDAPEHPEAYEEALRSRWRAVLVAASEYTKADCLVLSDAGCGVFKNDPVVMGEVLGQLLMTEFEKRFPDVIIASPSRTGEDFHAAVMKAMINPRRPSKEKAPVATVQTPQYDPTTAAGARAAVAALTAPKAPPESAKAKARPPPKPPPPPPPPPAHVDPPTRTRRHSDPSPPPAPAKLIAPPQDRPRRSSRQHDKPVTPVIWQFETGSGWTPFYDDAQVQIENGYNLFKTGGPARTQIQSGGKTISIDFNKMTQMLVGSKRVRKIFRCG